LLTSPRTASATQSAPAVSLIEISKAFPGVVANDRISIDIQWGEIHALLGENGAGKSTLMNILAGINQPDAGTLILDGRKIVLRSAAQAIEAGVGMVHQHFRLVNAFTVAENIHMGWKDVPLHIPHRELVRRTAVLSEKFGLDVRPEAFVHQLSAGEQQRVEILRVLARGASVLVLDEPTAVLTPAEARGLFESLRRMKESGKAIIFISHKLDEVIEIADRMTVLRRGRVVATQPNVGMDTRKLASLMVGREVLFDRVQRTAKPDAEVLSVSDLSALNDRGHVALNRVNLTVRRHEIVGIGGVAGNGQRELAEALTGVRRPLLGSIRINGRELTGVGPRGFERAGVGHIPEDRLRSGFAGALSVTDNAVMREYRQVPVTKGIWFSRSNAGRLATDIVASAQVDVPSLDGKLANLSGGNQQRLIAAREVRVASHLLVAVYPMRGLDVGAIQRLREVLMRHREAGCGILLISEELDELMELADRIAILYEGRVIGEKDASDTSREELGLLMGGKSGA